MEFVDSILSVFEKKGQTEKNIVPSKTAELANPAEVEKRAVTSILKAIDFGIKLTQQYCYEESRRIPFFIGDLQWFSEPDKSVSSLRVGDIAIPYQREPGFISTRDGWNNLCHYAGRFRKYSSLPAISGGMQSSLTMNTKLNCLQRSYGRRVIRIGFNSHAGSKFNTSVVGEQRDIMIIEPGKLVKQGSNNEDIPLTIPQMKELTEIFDDAYEKLRERELLFKEKIL